MDTPRIPVGYGELFDKISILEIKRDRITDPDKRRNVVHELDVLTACVTDDALKTPEIAALRDELRAVNETLWDIEDAIRDKEAAGAFDAAFIELARSVYRTNDQRSVVKRRINEALASDIVEEKSYAAY